MRDKYLLLVAYQGDPELAFAKDPSLSVEEWEALSTTDAYLAFLADIQTRFAAHLDTTLISHQAKASALLEDIYAGRVDMKYLKDVSKHYHDTLRLTVPIVERLGAQMRKEEELSSLKLVLVNRSGDICGE